MDKTIKLYEDSTLKILAIPCEDGIPDADIGRICDRILDLSPGLQKETAIALEPNEVSTLEGSLYANGDLWAGLALKLGFPGTYAQALGGEFGLPAARFLKEKAGMHVEYWKAGSNPDYSAPVVEVMLESRIRSGR